MTALTLLAALLGLTSCSQNDAMMNNDKETSIMDNNNSSDEQTTTTEKAFYVDRFTFSSTVGDVIADSSFSDFGRLLFPVDRNVPSTMTLREVSSSSVYVWYNYTQPSMTVDIINSLDSAARSGKQILPTRDCSFFAAIQGHLWPYAMLVVGSCM